MFGAKLPLFCCLIMLKTQNNPYFRRKMFHLNGMRCSQSYNRHQRTQEIKTGTNPYV